METLEVKFFEHLETFGVNLKFFNVQETVRNVAKKKQVIHPRYLILTTFDLQQKKVSKGHLILTPKFQFLNKIENSHTLPGRSRRQNFFRK